MTRDTALTCCIIVWGERLHEEGWRDDKRERERKKSQGKLGWFLSGSPLKMQDCYSTQMWLLFPACIRCLGNTKLIVTAWRGLSVLKHPSLWSLPPPSTCLRLITPVLSLCVCWPTHSLLIIFVSVTHHLCQRLCSSLWHVNLSCLIS